MQPFLEAMEILWVSWKSVLQAAATKGGTESHWSITHQNWSNLSKTYSGAESPLSYSVMASWSDFIYFIL